MNFTEYMRSHITLLDGGMGSLLQSAGLAPGEAPERWNISHPSAVAAVHEAYYSAGANVVNTNTFGANCLKYGDAELEEIVSAAMENARAARERSVGAQPKFIALDLGPTGKMLRPLGTLPFEEAVAVFAKTVRLGVKYGADLISIETMTDLYETKAALLAAKENSDLTVLVSNAYGENGRLLTGAEPLAVIAALEGLGADAVGVNCSFGPAALMPVIEEYLRYASVPVLFKPNAGLPVQTPEGAVYDVRPGPFAEVMRTALQKGVRLAGGCCGTTPEYIAALHAAAEGLAPVPTEEKRYTAVASYTHAAVFGETPLLIGERINPTGKKRMKQALLEHDLPHLLSEAVAQEERGADILDVNVGLPELDEAALLPEVTAELQSVTDLPLQLDSANPAALERAMRIYNGKPMVNSVNGTGESMKAVFPLLKKYGGVAVALTLDEKGIPETAEGRLAVAETIVAEAARYGIQKKDIVIDPLCMAVSAAPQAAQTALQVLRLIQERLGCHTVLGLSNVSFGLPARDALNGAFYVMAADAGLGAAIANPLSAGFMRAFYARRALCGQDENFAAYIANVPALADTAPAAPAAAPAQTETQGSALQRAIAAGLKTQAATLTKRLLETAPPLKIIETEISPALDEVGRAFEQNKIYLPQLLTCAEAAGAAFEAIKAHGLGEKRPGARKCKVLIATVRGDVHDIGKNIVKLLLENYGYEVIDLGKDVPPETVAETAAETGTPLVGLSALMTTTVPAMRETIRLLREKAPGCRVIVGGAVLTEEYAREIGADFYGRDAMATVRIAENLTEK